MRQRKRRKILKVGNVLIKSPTQLDGIRKSGEINTAILDYVSSHIRAGVSRRDRQMGAYRDEEDGGKSGTFKL